MQLHYDTVSSEKQQRRPGFRASIRCSDRTSTVRKYYMHTLSALGVPFCDGYGTHCCDRETNLGVAAIEKSS
jgi:hypothetical protein